MNALIPGVREISTPAIHSLDPLARIYLADLDMLPPPASIVHELDQEEQARAARFRAPVTAESFIRRRWLRRRLIALAHGTKDRDVRIESDELGRPSVLAPDAIRNLCLSTSSASRHALVAWTRARAIGVDIAFIDPAHATPEAAAIFMTADEQRDWSASGAARAETFFTCWTRKESILKAMGTGFTTDATTIQALPRDPLLHAPLGVVALDLPAPLGWLAAIALTT